MPENKAIVHQVSWYAGAYAATQLVTVLAAILTRRFLGPVQVGVWALIQVILSYAEYSTLGVANAIPREIPFYVGKGQIEKAASIKQNVLNFTFLMSFLLAAGIVVFAFSRKGHMNPELFYGLMIASGLVILQQMNNVLIMLLRAFKKFTIAGNQMFLSAIVNALLVAFLSYRFRLYGFMWAMYLSFAFNIIYILCHEKFVFRFKFNVQLIRGLITYGFSLMILALLGTFVQTIDRIMITKFLGLEMLGIYSIAVMTNGFVFSFPNSVGVVLLPNVSEKFGKSENRHDLINYLVESDNVFCVLMPVLIGFAWFLVPALINWVLPKFSHGIPALKMLVLGSFFMAVSQAYGNFIIVIRKQMWIFPVVIVLMLAALGLNYLAVTKGFGIVGVAVAQSIVAGLNFSLIFFITHFHLGAALQKSSYYAGILLKFVIMLASLLAIDRYVRFSNSWIQTVVQCVLFLIIYTVPLMRLDRKYHLVKAIRNKLMPAKPLKP